jgi:translation initiation factor 1 (eIF-1/SUI1)
MNLCPIRESCGKEGAIAEKQNLITKIVYQREKIRVRQLLTRINGIEVFKNELKQALAAI